MDVGIVWPTPWKDRVRDLDPNVLHLLRQTKATHLRVNLDHRNPDSGWIVARAREAGFQVLPILDLDSQNPDIPGFCDFCEGIIEAEGFPLVEILNEPKTMEGMRAGVYHQIATAAAKRLQRFRPQTRLLIAGDFLRFDRRGPKIDRWLRDARLDPDLFDAVAVHPYREPGRPTVTRFKTRAGEYDACRREFYGKPLVVTEVGWNLAEVTERQQAEYVYEELTIDLACGIEATYVYAHISEMHGGFGVLREDGSIRPAGDHIARFQDEQGEGTIPGLINSSG